MVIGGKRDFNVLFLLKFSWGTSDPPSKDYPKEPGPGTTQSQTLQETLSLSDSMGPIQSAAPKKGRFSPRRRRLSTTGTRGKINWTVSWKTDLPTNRGPCRLHRHHLATIAEYGDIARPAAGVGTKAPISSCSDNRWVAITSPEPLRRMPTSLPPP